MKVSLKWLSEYVAVPEDLQAFCDRLDLTGTGVEGAETLGAALDGVVIGKVLTCEPHPDSDHMHVVTVDVGAEEPLQIVCGAPNIAADIKVPVATIGAELPGGFAIKKSKLRGVVSCGMCCSQRELGLGSNHEGIWVLPEDAPVGQPIAQYAQLSDTVLDLEITPNRPDCLSMVGMAREVGAMYQEDYANPLEPMAHDLDGLTDGPTVDASVSVTIADPDRCARYTARVIDNVKVGPSPDWLAERVTAAGARSINNVVDVTNYILFLFGQPLHAFDYDRLAAADGTVSIVVRPAKEGEELTTLDGTERSLTPDMTLIATPDRPVALAGVMGGLDSEVEESTTTVLLEAATFNPAHTSRTSRNLGLISEASLRYERGVDDNPIDVISEASAVLLAAVSGGTVRPGVVDVYEARTEPKVLSFRIPRFCAMMGADIPRDFIVDILTRLGCTVADTADESVLEVVAPTFRPDLEREIDLYEEVLRLWGMDRIEATMPASPARVGVRSAEQRLADVIVDTLRSAGLNETMTYSFVDPHDSDALGLDDEHLGEAVELINPMSSEQALMRRTILPGLLHSVAYNLARGSADVQLFEVGTVFSTAEGKKKPKERRKVAGVMAGAMGPKGWNTERVPFDFFDGKGVLESLARELALPKVRFKALSAEEAPQLQPGRAAQMLSEGSVIGWLGEVHPAVAQRFAIDEAVVAFELDVRALTKAARAARPYKDVSVYPASTMDIALVVDEEVTHERLEQVITSAGGTLLEDVRLFDVYRDPEKVGPGKKSMAYTLTYRSADHTLTGDEVEKAHQRLMTKVSKATGAEIRG